MDTDRENALALARDRWVPTALARQMIDAVAPAKETAAGDMAHRWLERERGRIACRPIPDGLSTRDRVRAAVRGRSLPPTEHEWNLADLILRLLIDGATFLLLPDPLYAYRRHAGSVSHRLSVETVEAMLAAHESLPAIADPVARRTARTIGRDLRNALRYERLVADIKARRVGAVPMSSASVSSTARGSRRSASWDAPPWPSSSARSVGSSVSAAARRSSPMRWAEAKRTSRRWSPACSASVTSTSSDSGEGSSESESEPESDWDSESLPTSSSAVGSGRTSSSASALASGSALG